MSESYGGKIVRIDEGELRT